MMVETRESVALGMREAEVKQLRVVIQQKNEEISVLIQEIRELRDELQVAEDELDEQV